MTIKVAVHRVCDRCQHPFDATSLSYGEDLPKFEQKKLELVLWVPGSDGTLSVQRTLFSYNDLCADCERIVDGYVRRIRMEDPDEAKPKKAKKAEKAQDAVGVAPREARFEPEASLASEPVPEPVSTPLPSTVSAPVVEAPAVAPLPF